ANDLNPLDQVFLADFNGKLIFDWIPANEAFANQLDIPILSLFLSSDMISYGTHLPWQQKYDFNSNSGKIPMRMLLSELEGRRIDISKKGFSINLVSMWERYAKEKVRSLVSEDSSIVREGIISKAWVQKTYKELEELGNPISPRIVNKMVSLLALEVWYRLFIEKTMKPSEKL